MTKKNTPYEILGVDPKAGAEEIRRAHRKRARETHPDRGGSKEGFSLVQRSYETLIDPDRRKQYDETGTDDRPNANAWVSLAAQVLLQVVNAVADLKKHDVIAEARNLLRKAIEELDGHVGINVKTIDRFDEALQRLSEPDGHLGRVLENEKIQAEACNARNAKAKVVHEQALEYLKNCSYRREKPEPKNGIVPTLDGRWIHPFIFTAES